MTLCQKEGGRGGGGEEEEKEAKQRRDGFVTFFDLNFSLYFLYYLKHRYMNNTCEYILAHSVLAYTAQGPVFYS